MQKGNSYVLKGPVGASVFDVRITASSAPGGYSFKSCLKKADLKAMALRYSPRVSVLNCAIEKTWVNGLLNR